MLAPRKLSLDQAVELLRAAGEPTRMRLLNLLVGADLTVSDLIDILGQSQPRLSRHLRLLVEAGLAERHQEGAWAYFRAADAGAAAALAGQLLATVEEGDAQIVADRQRLAAVRERRARLAGDYFAANAAEWDALRSLHADDSKVEAAMLKLAGGRRIEAMLDLGVGTGRILELFAPMYQRGVGIDTSREMLAIARANLERGGVRHAQVRQGDLFRLPGPAHQYDLVTLHQVLHFLDDPAGAIRAAANQLAPGGRLLVADFAPHAMEDLRQRHRHLRPGFAREQVKEWMVAAGLDFVEAVDIAPGGGIGSGNGARLTVTLWLGADPRLQIAGAA
jgi:ArsR family transcriptional regulator